MRKRTPSEVKAYGDGYKQAFYDFRHLVEKNDKETAIRKMEIFANAVALTVETATEEADTPQADDIGDCNSCEHLGELRCGMCTNGSGYKKADTPLTEEDINNLPWTESDKPLSDCPWK